MAINDDEIDEIEQAVKQDITDGILSTTVDGLTVVSSDPVKRLDALERLERRSASKAPNWGIRTKFLVPPNGGGGPSPTGSTQR